MCSHTRSLFLSPSQRFEKGCIILYQSEVIAVSWEVGGRIEITHTLIHAFEFRCVHAAIEEELERAIFNAGGILESNFGNLAKISWTRSSRTDKGVGHSLSCALSLSLFFWE